MATITGCNCLSGSLNSSASLMIWSRAAPCSFGRRARLKAASNSSTCETGAERSSIGALFFVGIKKCPSFLRTFLADSHQRFHSVSLKTSPISHCAICGGVALPPALSRTFRMTAAGSSLASFLITVRSLAFRARKCSGGIAARFSAAYRNCIRCAFLPTKSMMTWLRSRFHSETRPNPQLLCKQKVPGLSLSSCSAAFEVSFPDSTSFCSSASIKGRTNYDERSGWREKTRTRAVVYDCRKARGMKRCHGADEHLVLDRIQCRRFRRADCRSCQLQAARPRLKHACRRAAQRHLDGAFPSLQSAGLEIARPGHRARFSDLLSHRILSQRREHSHFCPH